KTAEGFGLFDEAMLLAAAGRLGTFVLGKVYCSLISACDQLGELQRAAEWTEVGSQWAHDHSSPFFPGLRPVPPAPPLRVPGPPGAGLGVGGGGRRAEPRGGRAGGALRTLPSRPGGAAC